MLLLYPRARVCALLAILVMASPAVAAAADSPTIAADSPSTTLSPGLQAFITQALREHPHMQAARAELASIRAEAEAAEQPLYNPELALSYEETDVKERTLGVQQTFDWSDKREARASAADWALVAAKARFAATREAFIANLMTALADYEVAIEQAGLAEQRAELMQRFAQLAGKRQKVGDLPQADYNLAVLARTNAAMELARARSQQAAAQQQLRALSIGMTGAWPSLPGELPALNFDTTLDKLLAASPVMLAARANAQSAEAIVSLRRRQRNPDPTFGLRAGKEGEHDLIGFSISIPLFVRNSYGAELAAARAEKRQAMLNVEAIKRGLRAQLVTAGRRYQNIREAWQAWEESGAASLKQQINVLERLWKAGELSTTEYLVQLKQALDTRAGALNLKNELWTAWFDWLEVSTHAADWAGLPETAPTADNNELRN
ncbi:MAG TPA: TolC family protein [Gammaproteobacteria bacterium]|nr:TolC family protein [Gammaproteobacteria bacterium]